MPTTEQAVKTTVLKTEPTLEQTARYYQLLEQIKTDTGKAMEVKLAKLTLAKSIDAQILFDQIISAAAAARGILQEPPGLVVWKDKTIGYFIMAVLLVGWLFVCRFIGWLSTHIL